MVLLANHMSRSFANLLFFVLLLAATFLLLGPGSTSVAAISNPESAEELPPSEVDEGDPFADEDTSAGGEADLLEDENLFDDDPNQLVLEHDLYEDDQYYDDPNLYCEDEPLGCSDPIYCKPRRSCVWYDAGYLLWWTKATDPPALATTSPVGTDPNDAGVLGEAGTSVLFGDSSLQGSERNGGQFELGYWLDAAQTQALEVNYLFLGEKQDTFLGNQDNFPVLARPFLDVETGMQDSRLIAIDNLVEGTLSIDATTSLHTSAIAYRNMLYRVGGSRIDCLLGYRFAYLGDAIDIRESTLALAGSNAPGTTIDLLDSFETHNSFHGGEFGFEMQHRIDRCWSCVVNARVAIGGSSLKSNVFGRTITDDGATVTTRSGGLLTQDTNSGTFRDIEFNTVSNIGVTMSRRLFDNFSVSLGYEIFLWSHVWRAADQIDLNVNPTQIDGPLVGAALPAFPRTATSYWAHGIGFNIEGRF